MRGEVYLGCVLSIGFLPMTLPAEFSCLGFRRFDTPRGHLMLQRSGMARCATDEGMGRHTLHVCNLAVASGTFPRNLRRHWIVGVVTRKTRLKWIVEDRIYLGKSCGSRGVVGVTPQTEFPFPGGKGLGCGISCVCGRRAVACLAGHISVITALLLVGLIFMAATTDCRAREGDIFRNFSLRRRFSMKSPVYQ